jgi:uncharacterized DUF497 family protein
VGKDEKISALVPLLSAAPGCAHRPFLLLFVVCADIFVVRKYIPFWERIVTHDWDPKKAKLNRKKHNWTFEDALEVFEDPFKIEKYDEEHSSAHEERWQVLGQIRRGDVLFVVHVDLEPDGVRIISARSATVGEEAFYRRRRGGR